MEYGSHSWWEFGWRERVVGYEGECFGELLNCGDDERGIYSDVGW